mmetsp:Transcript_79641/g.234236  ORF Transcript_79641/g.234236 Transcript_79641/m.234236 type:complete len:519 (+) Transcript_79641:140-1696(+)
MLRASTALLLLALSARGSGAARLGRRQQPPGDVGAITGPVDDLVGSVGEDLATAAEEVQAAAAEVSEPAVSDPQSALVGAIASAEDTVQNLVPGRGLVTDVLKKSQAAAPTPVPAPAAEPAEPQVTFPPAPLNGVYCRGAACQYRHVLSVKGGSGPAEAGTGEGDVSEKEFCRGLACIPGSGHPADTDREQFIHRCVHLLVDVGGGLQGEDESREVFDVRESFQRVCRMRVDIHEADFCRDYSDVFVAALSPLFKERTVGGAQEVCAITLDFVRMFKQAEVDFHLFEVDAAPGSNSSGSSDATSSSDRVEIVPGSDDGALPAVTVGNGIFSSCQNQVGHITGEDELAAKTVRKVREWCGMQTIITKWEDVRGRDGDVHPEWTTQNCLGMTQLFAFALRDDFKGENKLSAQSVCKNLFLAIGAVHGVDRLVENGLAATTRGAPPLGLALPSGDPAMKSLVEETRKSAEVFVTRLQKQKEAADALQAAKEKVAAYNSQAALLAVSRAVRMRREGRVAPAA